MHLDLHMPDGERDNEGRIADRPRRHEALGRRIGPMTWITLADPEGNEFCVS